MAKVSKLPLVGAGKKKSDVAEWLALEAQKVPGDFDRLMAAVGAANSPVAKVRIETLAKRGDPKLVPGLLELLEHPPYTGGTSKKFWQSVIALLQASNDVRAHEAMLDLSKRYQRINGTFMGEWVSGALMRAAAKMKVGAAPAKTKKAKSPAADAFAQIVASVDDDAPRAIFADALTDRAEPRGEFITLQLERAAGRGTIERADLERTRFRESDLLDDYALPLSTAADGLSFHRGFPFAVHLKETGLAAVVKVVEWGTVRKLTGVHKAPVKAVLELLNGPLLPNLDELASLDAKLLSKLKAKTFNWSRVGLRPEAMTNAVFARLPRLTHLTVSGTGASSDFLAPVGALKSLTVPDGSVGGLAALLVRSAPRELIIEKASAVFEAGAPLESVSVSGDAKTGIEWLRRNASVHTLKLKIDNLFRDERGFDWASFGALLTMPQLTSLTVERWSGTFTAQLVRNPSGWSLVLPAADRWVGFYEDLAALARPLKALGVTEVTLYPEEPRHSAKPFGDTKPEVLADVHAKWEPLEVTEAEAFAWPGAAPGEGWVLNRRSFIELR